MDKTFWETKITSIKENEIRIHGYRIDDLMGEKTFAETAFLLFTGRLPEEKEGKMFELMMVSCADHGVTPPSTLSAITAASTGAPLNGALAAGILSINEYHGGAIENSMKMLMELENLDKSGIHGTIEAAAVNLVSLYKNKGIKLSGFGHRIHKKDPRTEKLIKFADDLKISGDYIKMLRALEKAYIDVTGKVLPVNVDGALGALLLEISIPLEFANAFFIMSRVPGLIAHIIEEQTTQKKMRKIDPVNHIYTGVEEKEL